MDEVRISEKVLEIKREAMDCLRSLIEIPSMSVNEENVIKAIRKTMEKLDFEEIIIDGMGNILGRMGNGEKVIAFDGHIDTVDVGVMDNWDFDPFEGKEDDAYIYGRGSSDQTGGFVSAMFAAHVAKKLDIIKDRTRCMFRHFGDISIACSPHTVSASDAMSGTCNDDAGNFGGFTVADLHGRRVQIVRMPTELRNTHFHGVSRTR